MELQLHRNLGGGSEHRFYIELLSHLTPEKEAILRWCLAETYDQDGLSPNSFLAECRDVLETGPNLRTTTPWSTTALDIFKACGLTEIGRIEFTRRIGIDTPMTEEERATMLATLYDRMTEMPYDDFRGFPEPETPKPVKIVPVLEHGMDAIVQINDELGLGMEPQDLNFCKWLFTELLKRDPTDVEMFQLGQANSEHCRHKRFRGQYTIDGVLQPRSMWDVVKGIYHANIGNSVLGLCDNSSALRGRQMSVIIPITAGIASQLHKIERLIHYILTVETHNFPTGIAPYPGAATGQGGMQRDLLGTGRGADMLMAGAGYIVDHLNDPKHPLSWEMDGWVHPPELASSLQIINEASLGGSDYLNCIGVPGTFGYCRSFALTLPDGSRRGKYKPTMTAMGCGTIDDENLIKGEPEVGLLALQLGGPALRVGLGGGAASSMSQGDNSAELDFNAVQRDDPYMEQLVWRVIRACIELGQKNPIVLIHDLGAGGSLNALTEALLPKGGRIDLRKLPVGDKSLSTLEIWGNEAQERMAILIRPEDLQFFLDICTREKAPCAVVGEVTGDGWIELFDSEDGSSPVHLPLREILDNLPQQSFSDKSVPMHLEPMRLPANTTIKELLSNVMRHLSVCSKRFLTEIADSSVGGCIISQQTVGPNSIPLADFALAAPSFDDPYGVAVAVGEQPVKGLISPEVLARLGIAEALMNLVGAGITKLEDVKFSANWMWPAKEPGEAAKIFAALLTTETFMHYLKVAIDGGKDSFSMVVKNVENPFGRKQHVLSPGELVFTAYAPVDDVEMHLKPYLRPGDALIYVPLTDKCRLGGSTLGLTLNQLGDECPDIDDIVRFARTFNAVTELVKLGKKGGITAIHDISDGGLIVAALEMAFAGNTGLNLALREAMLDGDPFFRCYEAVLFAEEPGLLLACPEQSACKVISQLAQHGVRSMTIGNALPNDRITVSGFNGGHGDLLDCTMTELRDIWEETSFELAKERVNPKCIDAQRAAIKHLLTPPPYHLTYQPIDSATPAYINVIHDDLPTVAVVRAPGSNGDKEMKAALMRVGFNVWDVNMEDLTSGATKTHQFQGLIFPGGFSFRDVLDSGKGWAGMIRFNPTLASQFRDFYERPDTWSLGVCNGCQFMALLGWVPGYAGDSPRFGDAQQPRFILNLNGRFRRDWVTVQVNESPSILFKNMIDSRLGTWVAHGEGRLHFPDPEIMQMVIDQKLAPLSYVGPDGSPTEDYPFNPNGSVMGMTSLCSPDGRHTAMMNHPERTFLLRQWPWMPDDWRTTLAASPWLTIFQNAFTWCMEHYS